MRAFENRDIDYYELTKDVGFLPKGTVFYHDRNDHKRGSYAEGCLKLCWTSDGNTQGGLCGDTVMFHTKFIREGGLFRKVYYNSITTLADERKNKLANIIENFKEELLKVL